MNRGVLGGSSPWISPVSARLMRAPSLTAFIRYNLLKDICEVDTLLRGRWCLSLEQRQDLFAPQKNKDNVSLPVKDRQVCQQPPYESSGCPNFGFLSSQAHPLHWKHLPKHHFAPRTLVGPKDLTQTKCCRCHAAYRAVRNEGPCLRLGGTMWGHQPGTRRRPLANL